MSTETSTIAQESIEYSVNSAGQDIYRHVIFTEWQVVVQP